MKKKTQTVWINRGPFPLFIAFCPSKKAWDETMERMNIQPRLPYPEADGRTSYFQEGDGTQSAIITIGDRLGKKTCPVSLTGLLLHEVVHVWQTCLDQMQEQGRPSRELEADSVQFLALQILDAFCETRQVLYKGWKPN